MIKKILIILMFTTAVSGSAYSQSFTQKNELTLGYGIFSTNEVGNIFSGIITEELSGYSQINESYFGLFYLSYKRSITALGSIGIGVGVDFQKGDYEKDGIIHGNYDKTSITVALEKKFSYNNKGTFYAFGGIGYSFSILENKFDETVTSFPDDSYNFFNFQITPIGFATSNKNLFGYAELGFGYKGILNAGISYKF